MVTTIFSTGLTIPIESVFAVEGQGILYATVPFNFELWTIVPGTGVSTFVGETKTAADNIIALPSLALHPTTGIMYAGSGGQGGGPNLWTVDTNTALVTLVGPTNEGNLVGLDFRSDGVLFASVNTGGGGSGSGGTHLGTVNTATGTTTLATNSFGFDRINSIAFFGGVLYGVSYNDELYTINTSTGLATLIEGVSPSVDLGASQFACDGTYHVGEGEFGDDYGTLDITNGDYTFILGTDLDETIGGFAFSETCQDIQIGGELIPLDTTALLLAGAQSISMWMIPVVISGAGIGVFVIMRSRK